MGNGHGGSRAGAGRKTRAHKHKGPIAEAEQRIADRLPSLVDNMFALADGIKQPDGLWMAPPCRMANQYLIDRILGRPTQAVEISGDGEPLPVALSVLTTESLNDILRVARELDESRPEVGPDGD